MDLITSRHLKRQEVQRCHGGYALDIASGRVETLEFIQFHPTVFTTRTTNRTRAAS